MREITLNEVKDPHQLMRYLRDMAQRNNELMNQPTAPAVVEYVPVPQREKLPDEVLADLQLTQIARVRKLDGTAAPTTNNNLSQGYTAGSKWYIPATPAIYECVYSDNSTATWVQVF